MAAILVTCDHGCGDIQVAPGQVAVRTSEDMGWAQYTLHCPECDADTVRPLALDKVQLLRKVGVKIHRVMVPAEAKEHVRLAHLPPLSVDDALDFALLLGTVTTVADVLPSSHPTSDQR